MVFQAPRLGGPETAVLAEIDRLREALAGLLHEPRRWTGSLRRLSFARAIQGSNSIEGFDARLDDAAAVALREEPLDAGAETERALAGYRDAMTYVLQLAEDPAFEYSVALLRSLHFMMTGYHLDNRPGRWRAGGIYVRDHRSGEIVYEGPDVGLVPGLMDELVAGPAADGVPLVVRAAMAHLDLAMVHPFRDGNGRMARCLQSLVLARGGAGAGFLSVEEYLGRNTDAYYAALAATGGGRWQPDRDTLGWVRFMLTAHLRQARTELRRFREAERLWTELEVAAAGLPERVRVALYDAALGLRVRNATYRAGTEEPVSDQTASRDLRQLAEAGLLVPHGEKRGRHYTAGAVLAAVRWRIVEARDPRDDSDPFAGLSISDVRT